jgi:D-sedoheptulose 7-phosphate isomerase
MRPTLPLTPEPVSPPAESAAGSVRHPRLAELVHRRTVAGAPFFAAEEERIAVLCHRMAERFARGGRLLATGVSPAARSDARHVAVEFVHPVIVGKRALPALALTGDAAELPARMELLARPDDIVLAFGGTGSGAEPGTREALAAARQLGCLTVAFQTAGAEWELRPPAEDPFVRQELVETLYHILWELVHVFFEHRGLLEGRQVRSVHGGGASSFLYPFLAEQEHDLDAVLADLRASVRSKAREIEVLRVRTVAESEDALLAAAQSLREVFDGSGSLLAFGNGGSATDAADLVADFQDPPYAWPARRALDLAGDPAILTAIANDIGPDALFSRQVIAYGQRGDAAVALSTSGNSRNILQALEEARRRGLRTIALVGYDGGSILGERRADHVIVAPSQNIPRIQEAQATAYHLLRELVEDPVPPKPDS